MQRIPRLIKNSIFTGLIILIPVVISVYVIVQSFFWLDSLLPSLLQMEFPPGTGAAGVLFIALVTGLIAKNYLGKQLIKISTQLIATIPILNKVYLTLQQIMDMLVNQKTNFAGKVVIIEYPRPGVWALGFITTGETQEISEAAGEKLVCVYIPTTPNPTSGFMLYLPESQTVSVKLSAEIAMKAVISAGIVSSAQTDRKKVETSLPDLIGQWMKKSAKNKNRGFDDPRD
jgi:uncharacterized membrane protein